MKDDVTTLIGGIYRDDNNDPDYDGCYALSMGRNAFYFLFDGIDDIENEVELACTHRMRLVEGYALGYNILKKEWYIRNSARKNQPDYVLQKGRFKDGFVESLAKFKNEFRLIKTL